MLFDFAFEKEKIVNESGNNLGGPWGMSRHTSNKLQ